VNRSVRLIVTPLLVCFATVAISLGQFEFERRWRGRRDVREDFRGGAPDWQQDQEFKHDVFTFVRIEFSSGRGRRGRGGGWYGRGRRGGDWRTDYPDSDLNFSYRLQELTSMQVDPDGKIMRLTDDELCDYPFVYVVEPGRMLLSEAEVLGLRKYLLNGGFMMVDDFWGPDEYANFYREIKRVFPNREPRELPLSHPIFNTPYKLSKKPQVPSIHSGWQYGHTYERGYGDPDPHYKGIFDDQGRMMTIICHNTDLGDGWEREGENVEYFRQFSEKWSYPLGINIVIYAMTH